ncbi:hypothetical protein B0H11DRAFT_2223128 [Mycena galericulata]|nr:hypothetical protein B0H11DRAFT_2223128 [Mycena galericulata]
MPRSSSTSAPPRSSTHPRFLSTSAPLAQVASFKRRARALPGLAFTLAAQRHHATDVPAYRPFPALAWPDHRRRRVARASHIPTSFLHSPPPPFFRFQLLRAMLAPREVDLCASWSARLTIDPHVLRTLDPTPRPACSRPV